MDGAEDAPRLRQARVVAHELEHGDRAAGDAGRPLRPVRRGVGVELDEREHQRRIRAEAVVSGVVAGGDRLAEHLSGLGELPDVHQRLAEVDQQVEPVLVIGRKERRRAPQQVRGGRHVAAREGPPARRPQPLRRLAADLAAAVVERSQLRQVAVGLLQVVAEDLLVLAGPVAVHLVGPGHEPLVQRRALALEQARVGRVADQDVLERERGAGRHDGRVRLKQPPPLEPAQVVGHARPAGVRHELDDGRLGEDLADDRCRADDLALRRRRACRAGPRGAR